ncbi:MAG TPA: hypothetical protein VIL22_12270 [Paenibacillaceae bacterium]
MREDRGEETSSAVWARYKEAKRFAAGQSGPERPQEVSLDEAIARALAAAGLPETGLPPRSLLHPSQYGRMIRWFYRLLVALFTALVAGLIWWGYRNYGTGG